MRTLALALLLAAAGCSAADLPQGRLPPAVETDAGGDVLAPPTTSTTTTGGAAGSGATGGAGGATGGAGGATGGRSGSGGTAGAPGSAGAGAGGSGTAGAAGSTTPADAGSSSPDATAPEAGAPDAAPPSADAKAGDVGEAGVDPICAVANPKCDTPNLTDSYIRATFRMACTEVARACGRLYFERDQLDLIVPLICKAGTWRYGGVWVGEAANGYFAEYATCDGHGPCPTVGKMCPP